MKNKLYTYTLIALILVGVLALRFALNKNKSGGVPIETPTPQASITPTPKVVNSPTPNDVPTPEISTPERNASVASPVTVKGTVPPGWMFEGGFPIFIKDFEGNVLAQGRATETTPGSWQSGNPVEFEASVNFPDRASGNGTIVLENDNPSGLPQNSKSYLIPITFK